MAELIDETPLNPEQKKFLGIMRNNGDALLSLINDILDLAKIEAGRLTLEQVDFDLENLTDTVSETFGLRAHAKGLELAVHLMRRCPASPAWRSVAPSPDTHQSHRQRDQIH